MEDVYGIDSFVLWYFGTSSLLSQVSSWLMWFRGKVTIRNGWLREPCKKQGFRNKVKCISHEEQGFRIDFWQGFRIDFDRAFVPLL
jgi:hypothetical protein